MKDRIDPLIEERAPWLFRDRVWSRPSRAVLNRMLGYTRTDAARLSMLMSIPTIIASGTLIGIDVAGAADASALRDIGIVITMSFAAALLALALMMRLLQSVSFPPYVIYRIVLGVILLWIAYT